MHPAALVLPARDNTTVHDSSLIIRSKIMEAAASSLALKDILLMDSISPTALKPVISICSIGSVKRSFFIISCKTLPLRFGLFLLILLILSKFLVHPPEFHQGRHITI